MTRTLKLYVLAGEPSGDRIAADLVQRLGERVPVAVAGVGGEALAAVGLQSQFDMSELSVMGWADVLPRLPRLLWRARQVARTIIRTRPDIVLLVDAQVFSSIVAGQVHRAAPEIPVLLCVAPAVWAWKPERARRLTPRFREVLAVLPFEPAVMRRVGGPETTYIGHPALDAYAQRAATPQRGPLLLLPGSREGELRRHLPLMRAIVAGFAAHPRVSGFVLPTPHRLVARLQAAVADWPAEVTIVSGEEAKKAAMAAAVGAVAVTGTVTLELALAGVPMVATYVADKGQAKRWFKYRIEFAALPNAILARRLVPEILQRAPDALALSAAVAQLLDDPQRTAEQLAGFAEIRRLMDEGMPGDPRTDPVTRILAHFYR